MQRWGVRLGTGSECETRRGSALGELVIALIAPLVAVIIQLAISRSREYAADSSGGVLSENPEALAEALERIEAVAHVRPYPFAGPATAHLFIVNPFSGRALARLFSTHPPVEERVARLRSLAARLQGGGSAAFEMR